MEEPKENTLGSTFHSTWALRMERELAQAAEEGMTSEAGFDKEKDRHNRSSRRKDDEDYKLQQRTEYRGDGAQRFEKARIPSEKLEEDEEQEKWESLDVKKKK